MSTGYYQKKQRKASKKAGERCQNIFRKKIKTKNINMLWNIIEIFLK